MENFWHYTYDNYYHLINNPWFQIILMTAVFFFVGTPFFLLDHFRLFQEYKIHPQKYVDNQVLLMALLKYITSEILVYVPLTILPLYFGVSLKIERRAPTTSEFVTDLALILIASDVGLWFMHRFMHTPFMYKHFHSVHHQYRAPFAWCTQSHHIVESIMMSLPVVIPTFMIGRHFLSQMFALSLIMAYGVESHSGYDFGIQDFTGGYHIIGFAPLHDVHHSMVTANYGAYFTIMDRIMGTYKPLKRAS